MKKALTLAICALLVAGAATLLVAESDWAGTADGSCSSDPVYYPLQPWEGHLYTESNPRFVGFWDNDVDNRMYGPATHPGIWRVYNGIWDYQLGEPSGTWAAWFSEPNDTCDGTWVDAGLCSGNLWGTEQ